MDLGDVFAKTLMQMMSELESRIGRRLTLEETRSLTKEAFLHFDEIADELDELMRMRTDMAGDIRATIRRQW